VRAALWDIAATRRMDSLSVSSANRTDSVQMQCCAVADDCRCATVWLSSLQSTPEQTGCVAARPVVEHVVAVTMVVMVLPMSNGIYRRVLSVPNTYRRCSMAIRAV